MDHPAKAIPMIVRVLSEDVADLSNEDVSIIVRLVAYHDLIGGILVSGRPLEELVENFSGKRELDALFALSKADAVAINPGWANPEGRARLRRAAEQALERKIP